MTFKEIQQLIKLVTESDLTEFKVKDDAFELSIKTKNFAKGNGTLVPSQPVASLAPSPVPIAAPAATPAAAPAASDGESDEVAAAANLIEIKSPLIGTFYRSPSPDKPAFLRVGDTVAKGDVVCIVEAMKLFNEIESEVSGKVVKILIEDAQPVEYDTPLFLVDPAG